MTKYELVEELRRLSRDAYERAAKEPPTRIGALNVDYHLGRGDAWTAAAQLVEQLEETKP